MRREIAHVERRSGTDRRTSNWRDATRSIPPSAAEALALRDCVQTIRALLDDDDYDALSLIELRELVDDIGVTIIALDQLLQRQAQTRADARRVQ
jgi:hypothetical protein